MLHHVDPTHGFISLPLTPPSLVLWLPNLNCVDTNTHTSPTPSILLGMRTSALNFTFWHQTSFSSHRPVTITRHSLTGLFSRRNKKEKKYTGRTPLLFSSSWETKTVNEKTQVFFIFIFFSNSRHNVYQYSNLSVRLHSQVQCANFVSHKPLDCLPVRHSL